MIEITGTVNGRTRFKIQEYMYEGFLRRPLFRVFIGGIYRSTWRSRQGAIGAVENIGPMVIEKEIQK